MCRDGADTGRRPGCRDGADDANTDDECAVLAQTTQTQTTCAVLAQTTRTDDQCAVTAQTTKADDARCRDGANLSPSLTHSLTLYLSPSVSKLSGVSTSRLEAQQEGEREREVIMP